jgi:DNA-binding XRE family transcriptional regulator
MKSKSQANGVAAKRVTVKGKRMVMLEEAEFDRLMRKADEWEPLLPAPDADGNYPADEAACVSIAIDIIRHRRRLGLSQTDLARRAGIRPESLSRIEQGHVRAPMIRTIEKIDRALREAEEKVVS